MTLDERLALVFEWYGRMVSERTGRLLYVYEPDTDTAIEDGSAIRDIASVWDVEILGRYLARDDLQPLVERSLAYWTGKLLERDGALVLDPARIGESSGIAHSAFLLLALLDAGRQAQSVALAEGIVRQQRADGSFRIHFGHEPDEGLEFYPGEALLALLHLYDRVPDSKWLAAAERGFRWCAGWMSAGTVDPELLVFYANWQSQYAERLHAHVQGSLREAVRDHVFALHERIVAAEFYDRIEAHPHRQATVEVACALEGLNDAYTIARRENDAVRLRAWEPCLRTAIAWLERAQRLDGTPRERGGFGHSLSSRTQRIDVTGHVLAGFIKSVRNGLQGWR